MQFIDQIIPASIGLVVRVGHFFTLRDILHSVSTSQRPVSDPLLSAGFILFSLFLLLPQFFGGKPRVARAGRGRALGAEQQL